MDLPHLQLEAGSPVILEQPDYKQLRDDRFERNRSAMKAVDPGVLAEVLPQESHVTEEEAAALCIQRSYRGYRGRLQYRDLLFDKFEEDERMRAEKMIEQVEEGELLVENHKLEVLLDDDATTRRNRNRNYLSKVLTIQRGWRAYLKRKAENQGHHFPEDEDVSKSDGDSEYSETESALGVQAMTVLTPEENQTHNGSESDVGKAYSRFIREKKSPIKSLINSECESVLSDYSEIAGPLEDIENELEVYIVDRGKLKTGDFVLNSGNNSKEVQRISGETDLEFAKRARKINILSLAQEFAELKKIDAHALPFDLHKGHKSLNEVNADSDESLSSESEEYLTESAMTSPTEEIHVVPNGETKLNPGMKKSKSASSSKHRSRDGSGHRSKHGKDRKGNLADGEGDSVMSSSGDFDVYNIESTLPQMDWATLEQQLQLAAEEEKKRLLAHHNDREEIRRKLAMGTDEEVCVGERAFRKPSLQTRMQGSMNLQICFMNDGIDNDAQNDVPAVESAPSNFTQQSKPDPTTDTKSSSEPAHSKPEDDEDFFKKQARLQDEAKIALAQACTMAHMQLEVEKQLKKKSPIADMVGIPSNGDGRWRKINRKVLDDMNLAQLQVLVNDLHTQIESLNEELVQMLMERDDLHMEQDSMLVDIEDLTR
ncbi:IQCJ-SCHIP1 readthrough transcript protein-like [Gigantopelta aegis]|uniref:IQCJ-SCHIP1 readthrough transcript protein-like n=1 Tax=Gigantopelta aegis TaxID=1735272 RepID=UPI001B88E466|nr:IQCJ-SCHIP1 readthrough transcript protein-like [Gigantopelta aegis]